MAITSLDGVIAGMKPPRYFLKVGATSEAAGVMWTSLFLPGIPGAAAIPATGTAGAAITTLSGQIPFDNPTSGQETYLARFQCAATIPGTAVLADLLWWNSGLATGTALTAVGSAAWPARDNNASSLGEGVAIAILATTTMTNVATTAITAKYTAPDGTTSKTATVPAFPATAVKGSMIPFALATGDTGVKSIESITATTSLTTAYSLMAYRVLATLDIPVAYTGQALDAVTGGLVKCFDNTVPIVLFIPNATTATTLNGQIIFTQG